MKRWREWTPRLLIESGVVMFSILLALAANEWWDRRETEASVQRSLRSIRLEIDRNREALLDVVDYHATLGDTLIDLGQTGATEIDRDLIRHGWMPTPSLVSAAWEAATATGLTADMSYETVQVLSQTYRKQTRYVRRRESIMPVIYGYMLEAGALTFSGRYVSIGGILSDVASWERELLEQYERAHRHIQAEISNPGN